MLVRRIIIANDQLNQYYIIRHALYDKIIIFKCIKHYATSVGYLKIT